MKKMIIVFFLSLLFVGASSPTKEKKSDPPVMTWGELRTLIDGHAADIQGDDTRMGTVNLIPPYGDIVAIMTRDGLMIYDE